MTRLTAAVLGLLCLVSTATAGLDRRPLVADRSAELRRAVVKGTALTQVGVAPVVEAQLTDTSEVYLDGRRCDYKDVPPGASVERLELAADRKTILRVHFRSPK